MEDPEDVAVMLRLHGKGFGAKRIALELGVSRNTVRRYLRAGGYVPYGGHGGRAKVLDGYQEWVGGEFHRHGGNADVVRQELEAQARATVRFETEPGRQLQGDFGQATVEIGGKKVRIHLCVLTLGYSRRVYVEAFEHEQTSAWFGTMDGAFRHFGGVPKELLVDNARALVSKHNSQTREVVFTPRFSAFARYWRLTPKACAPYRARTKGKDERGVGYVKRNAIAGRSFASMEELRAHLVWWMREVADVRVHGTTGERPIDRFEQKEQKALSPLEGRPPFEFKRELERVVHNDLCVEVDTNHYSVPWRFIGKSVLVCVSPLTVEIAYAGRQIAHHERLTGRKQRSERREHYADLRIHRPDAEVSEKPGDELLRPLAEYEEAAGGSW